MAFLSMLSMFRACGDVGSCVWQLFDGFSRYFKIFDEFGEIGWILENLEKNDF